MAIANDALIRIKIENLRLQCYETYSVCICFNSIELQKDEVTYY